MSHATFLWGWDKGKGRMKSTAKDILSQPLVSLELSKEFKVMAQINHFRTLAEIVELPIDVLQKMPQFSYRIMAEYISFLESKGLGELLED